MKRKTVAAGTVAFELESADFASTKSLTQRLGLDDPNNVELAQLLIPFVHSLKRIAAGNDRSGRTTAQARSLKRSAFIAGKSKTGTTGKR